MKPYPSVVTTVLFSFLILLVHFGSSAFAAQDIVAIDTLNDTTPANLSLLLFDSTTLGTFSDKQVSITNAGNLDLHISAITQNSPGGSPFSILTASDTCSGTFVTVTPGAKCSFTIRYSPLSLNDNSLGAFNILSDSPGEGSVAFSVRGTPRAIPVPIIRAEDQILPLNDKLLAFGNSMIGETKEASVTLKNAGNADLNITSISQIQPSSSNFGIIADGCTGLLVQPNIGECTVIVGFSPTGQQDFSASFDILSDDPDKGTLTMRLSGTGTMAAPKPDIRIQDTQLPENDRSITFGRVGSGSILEKTVRLLNDGNGDLTIGFIGRSVGESNPIAPPFSIVLDQCSGRTLLPAENCAFAVRFSADEIGHVNEAFSIPSNDPDEPSPLFTLNGTGVKPVINNAPSSPGLEFPANGQASLGSSPVVSWNKSTDPEGDAIKYTVHVCEDASMTIACIAPIEIQAIVASVIKKTAGSVSLAGLGIGTGLVFGMTFIGGVHRRKKVGMFVAAMVVSGTLLASCSGGGGGGTAAPDPGLSTSLSGLKPGKTYFWKVIAKDQPGEKTTSDIWKFTA